MFWVYACPGGYRTANRIVPQAFLLTHSVSVALGLAQDGESDRRRDLNRGQRLCRQVFLEGVGNQRIQGPTHAQWCESSISTH